jgi:hypothetical protein
VLPEWFQEYLGLESAASVIRSFELQFVYGLFQTEEYARAVTLLGHNSAPKDEVDRRVSLRMKRQTLLASPQSPRVWSVLDEGVLRRPVGGRSVLRNQLTRLTEVAGMPRVTLQVVPFARGGHAAASGAFSVLRFQEPEVPDVVFAEQLTSALYLDKRQDVDHYIEVMDLLSAQALTPAETRGFLAKALREALQPRVPLAAARLGHRDAGRDRDVEGADPARLRDVGDGVHRGEQRGGAAVVLVPDRQADVTLQRCVAQRQRARGELDRDDPEPVVGRRLRRGGGQRLAHRLEETVGAQRRLADRRQFQIGRVPAQPQLLRAERGRRPHDRSHVERLRDGVKQERQAPFGAALPVAVEALDVGRAQLPRRA